MLAAIEIQIPYSVIYCGAGGLLLGIIMSRVLSVWRRHRTAWPRVTDMNDLSLISMSEGARFEANTTFPSGRCYIPDGCYGVVEDGRLHVYN